MSSELLLPKYEKYVGPIEVSIVVPALNEKITIGEFVDWCWAGLEKANVSGEVLIIDSSNDETSTIALEHGARVLRVPKRGLGQAYLDSVKYIRGEFAILGDCDLTYDFREIGHFVNQFRSGSEFVMGSRFKGVIEKGAMPSLHRYFGTPLTTWILNKIYGTKYSDIHCGMRGISRDLFTRMNLTSTGWEYASEMVLKASRLGAQISEVPVTFYKDREGRVSHHVRSGFWSPWLAGWINLKVMLIFSPDSFLIKPGFYAFFLGLILMGLSLIGGVVIGGIELNLYSLLAGVALSILGVGLFQIGLLARMEHGLRRGIDRYLVKYFSYDHGMFAAGVMGAIGLILEIRFVHIYIANGYQAADIYPSVVMGFYFIILGFQFFSITLLMELKKRLGTFK